MHLKFYETRKSFELRVTFFKIPVVVFAATERSIFESHRQISNSLKTHHTRVCKFSFYEMLFAVSRSFGLEERASRFAFQLKLWTIEY